MNFTGFVSPLVLRNAVSQLSTHWLCWDKKAKGFWIRDMPKECINEENCISKYGWDFFISGMQFETFIVAFAKWYQKKHNKPVMCGVGIRTNESFNRFRTIVSLRKETWKDYGWTTLVQNEENLPIYNFIRFMIGRQEIFGLLLHDLILNIMRLYELFYKAGLSIHEARICQPYGDDQRKGA